MLCCRNLMCGMLIGLFLFTAVGMKAANGEKKYAISGYLKDAKDGEIIIGGTILVKELKTGASTNVYGFYSLSVPAGKYTIIYRSIGYKDKEESIEVNKDIVKNIELSTEGKELQTIEIQAIRSDANIKNVEMSTVNLDIKTIQKVPALFGEVDLVRTVQLLPGVSTVGEGATGFNVRGGSIDQNLILLDEAPVYNSSHLFGFFSVFNPDAVKDVKLIKGGIPAQYGGRLSSILDVRMKDGNNKKFTVNGGLGVIFSRLSIEGPIDKGKGSFIVAGRRSYIDVLSQPFLSSDLKSAQFYFYDLTAKANYTLGEKDKVFASGYMGRDVFGIPNAFGFNWGNITGTLRWNHVFHEKLFLNTSLIYSNFDYALHFGTGSSNDVFDFKSKIINYIIKPEFSFFPNEKNTVKFGLVSTYYDFVPGIATATSNGVASNFSMNDKFAMESGLYASNEQKIGKRIIVEYGLRLSYYQYLGGDTVYTFNPGPPNTRLYASSTYYAPANTNVQTYAHLEPRAGIKYDLTENSSIKASYNRMSQNIHLVSNTTASIPLDVWTPSTNNIKSSVADQGAIGYFRNFGKNDMYETSLEGFYKATQNQLDYIDGAALQFNSRIEGDLMSGIGRAYGGEVYIRKAKGVFTGWISYTLSRAETKINGINQNNWYPDRFDRTHNLNVVTSYALNERVDLSANFILQSGTPTTLPTNREALVIATNTANSGTILVPINANDNRNNARIPVYNRLDLSATVKLKKKEKRKWDGSWVFSIYNVYSQANPFTIYPQQNAQAPNITEIIQYMIIAKPVPAVAFNFNF